MSSASAETLKFFRALSSRLVVHCTASRVDTATLFAFGLFHHQDDELIHHGADAVEDLVWLAVVPEEPRDVNWVISIQFIDDLEAEHHMSNFFLVINY